MSDAMMSLRVLVRDIKPFNAAVVGFVAMTLLGVAALVIAIIGLTKVKAAHVESSAAQAKAMLQSTPNTSAVAAMQAINIHSLVNKVHSFHNYQYAVIVLGAIVFLLSLWGFIVSGRVIFDYYNNNGQTEGDVNMMSSMGSFIFIQMVLMLTIAIIMTVEYTKLRKPAGVATGLSPIEKQMSDYALAQFILGYGGVLGGLVIGSIMRTSRPDKKA